MRHDTDAGRNKTKESEFSVKRKRQNRERLQRKKVVDKREEMKLRGMLKGSLLVVQRRATLARFLVQRNCICIWGKNAFCLFKMSLSLAQRLETVGNSQSGRVKPVSLKLTD